jgi:hypothetical protein
MAIIKNHVLDIRKSELSVIRVTVPAWEGPVLQAVHGEEVQFVDEVEITRDPPDSAGDEYERLANKYRDEADKPPFVHAVYGAFAPGVAALQKAMDAAITEEKGSEEAEVAGDAAGIESAQPLALEDEAAAVGV